MARPTRKRGRGAAEVPVGRGCSVAPPSAETLADTRSSTPGGGPRRKFRPPMACYREENGASERPPPAPTPDVLVLDFGRAPQAARQACRRTFRNPERVEREGLVHDVAMFPPKIIKGSRLRKKFSAPPRSAEPTRGSPDGEPMELSPQVHMQLVAAMQEAGTGEVGQAFLHDFSVQKRYQGVVKLPKPPARWIVEYPSQKGLRLSIGLFDSELLAARVRDLVAIKISYLRGLDVQLNFQLSSYFPSLLTIFAAPEAPFLQSLKKITTMVPSSLKSGNTQWRGVSLTRDSKRSAFVAYLRCSSRKVQNLGRFLDVRSAARAFDMACLRLRGLSSARTNFPKEDYMMDMPYITSLSMDALVKELQLGLSPQVTSSFLGVSLCSKTGLWRSQVENLVSVQPEAVSGHPDTHGVTVRQELGFWEDDIHAARAHDLAAILVEGLQAQTNFPVADYSVEFPSLSRMTLGELAVHLQQLSESFRTVKASQRKIGKIEHWAAAPEMVEVEEGTSRTYRSASGLPAQTLSLPHHKVSHVGWMPLGVPAPRPHFEATLATGPPLSSVDAEMEALARAARDLTSPRLDALRGAPGVGTSERTMAYPQMQAVEPPAEADAEGDIKIREYFKLTRSTPAHANLESAS